MDHLHRRPADLADYVETEVGRATPEQKRKERIAFYGGHAASLAIVAWALLYSNPDVTVLPWWWWPLLVIGWLLLAIMLSAAVGMVLFHGSTWRCMTCNSRLEERKMTDVSPKLGELNATIYICHRCRKFQPYLSTQSSD